MRKRACITIGIASLAAFGFALVRPSVALAEDMSHAPPTGPFVHVRPSRPADPRDARACSTRHPICVHGRVGGASILAVVASADRAWDVVTGALELPEPDPDLDTRAYDVYVADAVDGGSITASSTRDPRSTFDRASAFTLLDASLARESCALDFTMARAIARASLFRVAPATDEGSARAETSYLARLAVPCAMTVDDGIAAFQASADRAIVDTWPLEPARIGREFDHGASLFFWWLDATYGASPGSLVRAMWALSPTKTPLGAERWNDEPDGFDVLAMSFRDALTSGSKIEDLFAEFGTTRALMGLRENGLELPEARALGASLAPPLAWEIDWPTSPRRLASPVPIAPTGSSYVLVHHDGASPGARLRVEATWEQHAAIRWFVVKLDAQGREMGRVSIAAPPRATEAQMTMVNLDGVSSLLIAATNVGDPFAPFDPDDETFEPHGWLLTLASE
jgi:hypothetical protein